MGLPELRDSNSASRAAFWRIFSASRKSTRPRSCGVVVAHGPFSNAALAAATARFTSSPLASGTCAITSSLCWIVYREVFLGLAGDPFAVDIELIGSDLCFHSAGHSTSGPSLRCPVEPRSTCQSWISPITPACTGRGTVRSAPLSRCTLWRPYTKKKNAAMAQEDARGLCRTFWLRTTTRSK